MRRYLIIAIVIGLTLLIAWPLGLLPDLPAFFARNEVQFVLNALGIAVIAMAISTAALMAWCMIARPLGLWDPGIYHKWLWIPWRPIAELWLQFRAYVDSEWRSGKRSTGGFAGALHKLCLVYKPGDVLLGRLSIAGIGLFQPLGQKLERHLFMFAGTGAGKTTLLITMLGLHPGNAFVIDPKGQIATILRRRRGKGGDNVKGLGKDVAILDPYSTVRGISSSCWNPLDEIERAIEREGKGAAVKYAKKIAEGLIRIEGRQPFFPRAARKFLTGLILHILTTEPARNRTMLRVYELVNRGYADKLSELAGKPVDSRTGFKFLLEEMAGNTTYAAIPSASSLFDDARSAGDVMATLKVSLSVFDNEQLRAISSRSDFSLHDLKLGNQDVFVCAPTGAVNGELSDWFRMLTVMALGIFEYIPGDLRPKCFFAIDELPSLGNIEKLDKGPAVLRSYGVQLLGISQTIQALKDAYPETWTTWVGNADAVYWMGTNDDDTAGYLAKVLGSATRDDADREIMDAEQVKRFLEPSRGNMIVSRFGRRALKVKTSPYFQELPVMHYDPDPDHLEAPLRAQSRQKIAEDGFFGLVHIPKLSTRRPQERSAKRSSSRKSQSDQSTRTAKDEQWSPGFSPWARVTENQDRKRFYDTVRRSTSNESGAKRAQAMAIFGLSGPCTLNELRLRKAMLDKQAAQSDEYKRLVEDAYKTLYSSMRA